MLDEYSLPRLEDVYTAEDMARFRAEGYWADDAPHQVLDRWAEAQPDALFLTDSINRLTYGEFRAQAYRLALALKSMGVGHGDRILLQIPNWTELLVAAMATSRLGAIVVAAQPIYREDEVRYLLEHSGAKIALTAETFRGFDHAAMFGELQRDISTLEKLIVVRGDGRSGLTRFESLAGEIGDMTLPSESDLGPGPTGDDGHVIIYTSGTESRPKGCFHTFNTVGFSARLMQVAQQWTKDDVAFGPSPVTHSTGYVCSYLLPMYAGAASHLMDVWAPDTALRQIAEFRCTKTCTATPFLKMVIDAFDPAVHDASTMRVWIAAGSVIPPAVVEDARRVLPTCEILSHYGRSENMVATTCPVGVAPEKVLTSDGPPPPGVEMAILGDNDVHLPPYEVGDIAYRGPGHMIGYFRDPERTQALFSADRFSKSGDLGYLDDDGFLRVSGRAKDIIVRGGMNISAREVEDHLLAHPLVDDVAVVAMPDERLGERCCAFVVASAAGTPTLDDLCVFLREHEGIAAQKLPERLEIAQTLPTTATGKVQKFVLREQIKAILSASVPRA